MKNGRYGEIFRGEKKNYGSVEGDAAFLLVDAIGGFGDANAGKV